MCGLLAIPIDFTVTRRVRTNLQLVRRAGELLALSDTQHTSPRHPWRLAAAHRLAVEVGVRVRVRVRVRCGVDRLPAS